MPPIIASIIWLVVTLVVLGLAYWVILQFPLPDPFPRIFKIIFVVVGFVVLLLWLLSLVGMVSVFPMRPLLR